MDDALVRPLLTLLLVAFAAACSTPFGGGDGPPVLVNRTRNALLYVAFDLRDGPLVDPNPAIDPADAPERLVAAGDQRAIILADYSGEGVLLFLYEIPAQDRAGPVPLSRTLRVTQAELLRNRGRIVIDER
ncbi:MAG TPA: hypothetical protein VGC13_06010 [Longimicrobium sp.]|jgi:hypothetical protein|uniref:hypothetical protein n=1 Tax=Longimicrobium sp. TaxID=2029185 RepID=UPI002ED787F3